MIFEMLLLLTAAAPNQAAAAGTRLIFQIPDGARGGVGKIDGLARPTLATHEVHPENSLGLLKRCGLRDAMVFDKTTHRFFIHGKSTFQDVRIVSCFKRLTYRHFTVGRGQLVQELGGYPSIVDETVFRQFWRKGGKK